MSKTILNHTAGLHRTIKVKTRAGNTDATINRIGAPSIGRDGRMYSMVYATTKNGPVAFACVNDGPPAWMS